MTQDIFFTEGKLAFHCDGWSIVPTENYIALKEYIVLIKSVGEEPSTNCDAQFIKKKEFVMRLTSGNGTPSQELLSKLKMLGLDRVAQFKLTKKSKEESKEACICACRCKEEYELISIEFPAELAK